MTITMENLGEGMNSLLLSFNTLASEFLDTILEILLREAPPSDQGSSAGLRKYFAAVITKPSPDIPKTASQMPGNCSSLS